MESIGELFKNHIPEAPWDRKRYISYFAKKMGWTERGMHFTLIHLKKLADLAYIKSDCDAAEREGRCAWPAAFRDSLHLSKKYKNGKGT